MPTERKRAIRTTTAWNADQAAMEALYGVNGYYTSPSLWEAGEQDNLVNLDQIRTGVCYNDWPSGLNDSVTIAGWTTDATRYVKITVAEGHRHNGTPGTGFGMTTSQAFSGAIRANQNYTRVIGVDMLNTASSVDGFGAGNDSGTGVVFSECIARMSGANARAFRGNSATFEKCLAYSSTVGFDTSTSFRVYSALNCVASNCGTGFYSGGNVMVKNCVAYGGTQQYSTTFNSSSTNNASSAASGAPGANPVHSITSADFANAAANDFHLSAASVLRGAGANLYSDFTTDIDGDTWPSSGAWDIGFDHYVEAGGSLTINSITASNITQTGARITLGLTR